MALEIKAGVWRVAPRAIAFTTSMVHTVSPLQERLDYALGLQLSIVLAWAHLIACMRLLQNRAHHLQPNVSASSMELTKLTVVVLN